MEATLQINNILDNRVKYDVPAQDLISSKMASSVPKQYQRNSEDVHMLKFPSTKNILWDHESIGQPHVLHISYYRKPKLSISEKVLRFVQRHAENSGQKTCSCVLVGTLVIEDDGEGVVFSVERMDPAGDPNSSTSHAAGDMLIPFTVQNGVKERGSSVEDYSNALQLLKQRCASKDPVELANMLLTKGWCSFYSNGEKCVHHLEFDVVTLGTEIKAAPIGPVPIVPTALSKNLSGPMSISHMQGTPKTGYLTMDHTRKLLLVLESDPKVVSLPLVGIWVSGVRYAHSPYVWSCCLRYLHNSSIQDRVCSPPDPFLLVLYNPSHSKPEFYECTTSSGTSKMTFDIYTGYEALQMEKMSSSNETIEVDFDHITSGQKYDQFEEAVQSQSSSSPLNTSRRSVSPGPTVHEDITPRLKPAPYKSNLPLLQSMVPEVTLFFGDEDTTYVPNVQHPKAGQTNPSPLPSSSPQHPVPSASVKISVPNSIQSAPVRNSSNMSAIPNSRQTGVVPSLSSGPAVSQQCIPKSSHIGGSHQQPPQPSFQPRPGTDMLTSSQPQFPPHQPRQAPGYPYRPPTSFPSYPPSSGPNPRPGFCTCPSCPRPPQYFNNPPQYDGMRGHAPNTRPMYPGYVPHPQPPVAPAPYPGYQQYNTGSSYPPHQHGVSQGYNQISEPNNHYPTSTVVSNGHHSVGQADVNNPVNLQTKYGTVQAGQDMMMSSGGRLSGQQQPTTQTVRSVPVPQASGGMPVMSSAKILKTPVQSNEYQNSVQSMNGSHNNNEVVRSNPNSDNSGRSSDDSGLSFTPEKHHSPSNPTAKQPEVVVTSSMGKAPVLGIQAAGVNWDNVPPEIYQLLAQQDQQLKQLQAKIELLTSQQAASLNVTADSQVVTGKPAISPQMQSAATNTSFKTVEQKEQVSACMQTSLEKGNQSVENSTQSSGSGGVPAFKRDASHSSSNSSVGEGRTPYEIRHRGRLPMNSTQREDAELDISQGELVALMNNMHDRTIDSVQSEMIVDLPSFQSSPTRSPQGSCNDSNNTFNTSPQSPISASMCEQDQDQGEYSDDEEEEVDDTAGTDPEYYNKLMDNIKKLLSQNTTEMNDGDGYQGDISSDPSTPVRLAREEVNLGANLQSFLRFDQSTRPTSDTTFIPKINYVSMLLDSDTDTSMEINAMAMKYLKDEQLTQLTKLQAKQKLMKGSKNSSEKTAMLQKILKAEDESTPNVTTFGMSPNDMTFATKRYMERHGLLDLAPSGGSTPSSDMTYNESYKLKTNYSTVSSSGSDDGAGQVTHEVLGTPTNGRNNSESNNTRGYDRSSLGYHSHKTTPHNWQTPHNDSRQSVGMSRTPRPTHTQSRAMEHRRFTPNGHHDSSFPASTPSNGVSPLTHNASVPQRDGHNGANLGRYASPLVTPAFHQPKHSPPVKENAPNAQMIDTHAQNEGFVANSPAFQGRANVHCKQSPYTEDHGVPNYYSTRQHREETNDDDRILDITRLKQLPKLL